MRSILVVLAGCFLLAGAAVTPVAAANMQQGTKMSQSDKVKGCVSQADSKKLAGAARTSFLKKCES